MTSVNPTCKQCPNPLTEAERVAYGGTYCEDCWATWTGRLFAFDHTKQPAKAVSNNVRFGGAGGMVTQNGRVIRKGHTHGG